MTEFDILPGAGIGPVHLGMTRTEVRRNLGPSVEFRRTPTAPCSDRFIEHNIIATYSSEERLLEIEINAPSPARLFGVDIWGMDLDDAATLVEEHSSSVNTDGEEFIEAFDLGLSLFCVDRLVSSVWVGQPDPGASVEQALRS